jgi:hypothetical protein
VDGAGAGEASDKGDKGLREGGRHGVVGGGEEGHGGDECKADYGGQDEDLEAVLDVHRFS